MESSVDFFSRDIFDEGIPPTLQAEPNIAIATPPSLAYRSNRIYWSFYPAELVGGVVLRRRMTPRVTVNSTIIIEKQQPETVYISVKYLSFRQSSASGSYWEYYKEQVTIVTDQIFVLNVNEIVVENFYDIAILLVVEDGPEVRASFKLDLIYDI